MAPRPAPRTSALAAAAAVEARHSAAADHGRGRRRRGRGHLRWARLARREALRGERRVTDYEVRFDGAEVQPAAGWALELGRPRTGDRAADQRARQPAVLVEGAASEWFVTLAGRRIPVASSPGGSGCWPRPEARPRTAAAPVDIRATLPGLVVAVNVAEGDEVAAGATLLTIEAMKMQNEVRAPRGGRVGCDRVWPPASRWPPACCCSASSEPAAGRRRPRRYNPAREPGRRAAASASVHLRRRDQDRLRPGRPGRLRARRGAG